MFKKRLLNKPKALISDQQQQLGNQKSIVRKKVKLQVSKGVLSSTTRTIQQQIQKDVRQSLDQLNYKGTNAIAHNYDAAVLQNLIDTEKQKDARAKLLQNIQITKKIKDGTLQKGVYRGLNSYANYNVNEQLVTNSKHKGNFAPLRAPTNIRISCRFDYNPQLCKDWHDSGYCVFGNSCLYLHDRSQYKTGWELQKDFEEQERQRWKKINNPDYQEEAEYKQQLQKHTVPQVCLVCENLFIDPVAIQCGHIYCQKCAISLFTGKKKCLQCKKATAGILNDAAPLLQKLKTKYDDLKKQLQTQAEINKTKRRRFKEQDSQKIFET